MNKLLSAIRQKKGKSPPPQTVQAVIAVSLAALALIGIAIALPIAIRRHNRAICQYSGAETDPAVQLQYDENALGDYKTVSSKLREDGRYHEELLAADGAVNIQLWRDFERPKMSLELQIREKYPISRAIPGSGSPKTPSSRSAGASPHREKTVPSARTPLCCCARAAGITWRIFRWTKRTGKPTPIILTT